MTDTSTFRLDLPFDRPPLNWNDRHNRWKRAELVAEVRRDVSWLAKAAKIPHAERITVRLHYATGRRGRFDAMNFGATSKPAIDGLIDAGVVVDDDTAHVFEPPPEILLPPEPGPRCWLTVTVHEDSPAGAAGSQPPAPAGVPQPDWHRIAVQMARYGGSYYGLKTWERDALEAEVAAENERAWGTEHERTQDAADRGKE